MPRLAPHNLPSNITALLARLRQRIRAYIAAEGTATVLIVLGAAFWLILAADWLFEPPPRVRIALLGIAAAIAAATAWRRLFSRLFTPLADSSLALLLEKYTKGFQDSLLTSVELADAVSPGDFHREMYDFTQRRASDEAAHVKIGDVFNPRPLMRRLATAFALAGSIAAFAWINSPAFGFYLQRLRLSEELWPRRNRVEVAGFPKNAAGQRVVKVARGGDLDLTVLADNSTRFEVPEQVEIFFRLADGSRGRDEARRIGEALAGRDPHQEFRYTFAQLFQSLSFDVAGGDSRVRGLSIEVVDSPQIVSLELECRYPGYMHREPRRLAHAGTMQIPEGTEITLVGRANKDLVKVQILDAERGELATLDLRGKAKAASAKNQTKNPSPQSGEGSVTREFRFALPKLENNRLLYFVLTDADGIVTPERDRYRLALSALADEPPQVQLALKGVGVSVTPQVRIPVAGKISDDYGVARAWFAYRREDEDDLHKVDLMPPPDGRNEVPVDQALDLAEAGLVPKQKLIFLVQAADGRDLGQGPNVAGTPRYLLDVVTPDELRAQLERRELLLRKRFETIYSEMIDTRDLLARINFAPGSAEEDAAPPKEPPPEKPEASAKAAGAGTRMAFLAQDAGPPTGGGKPAAEPSEDPDLARRKLRIVRAVQNVQRYAHETTAVATAFDEIYAELANNRLDTEELQDRLQDGIARPLTELAAARMPELEKTLARLEKLAADGQAGPPELARAVAQADAILVEMKEILNRMLELENFNEVLELLRQIVQDQDKLHDKTRQRSKQKLKNLNEE